MSLGSIADKRVEFVRMKGPAVGFSTVSQILKQKHINECLISKKSKGYAEMAVSRFDNKPPNTSVPSTPSNSDSVSSRYKNFERIQCNYVYFNF